MFRTWKALSSASSQFLDEVVGFDSAYTEDSDLSAAIFTFLTSKSRSFTYETQNTPILELLLRDCNYLA